MTYWRFQLAKSMQFAYHFRLLSIFLMLLHILYVYKDVQSSDTDTLEWMMICCEMIGLWPSVIHK